MNDLLFVAGSLVICGLIFGFASHTLKVTSCAAYKQEWVEEYNQRFFNNSLKRGEERTVPAHWEDVCVDKK